MLSVCYRVFFIIIIFQSSLSERRIKDGSDVKTDHRFMVYLLKAPKSPQHYDEWICGGAIVKPEYIITSAACVEDIVQMYAVAGYKKYVTATKLNDDPCTKEMKKKIVQTCVPKKYEFRFDKLEKWSYNDIAVAKVESPFDFNDRRYTASCSYTPAAILVNYNAKYQNPGYDAIVLGWGHTEVWRQTNDTADRNQETLKYAPVLIQSKEVCKEAYKEYHDMTAVIDSYMICVQSDGNIDDMGEQRDTSKPTAEGCVTSKMKLMGAEGALCVNDNNGEAYYNPDYNVHYLNKGDTAYDKTRRNGSSSATTSNSTRRHGICQNDHGGPLVSWVGKHQYIIGVASVFMVDHSSRCAGPYLFTSTQCNGAFLYCVLEEKNKSRREGIPESSSRSSICKQPAYLRGFDIVERRISWVDHPDGPAESETIPMRPQVPISMYG